jgi:hypothetical protein
VHSGKNLKSLAFGFRVWREIEKELLLVGGGQNLKSLSLGFRVWSEIEKTIVSGWWQKLEKSVFRV